MSKFTYTIVVDTDTEEHADRVISERIGHDEEYWETPDGEPCTEDDAFSLDATTFDYTIDYA